MLITLLMRLWFFSPCSSVVQHLKVAVRLAEYKYPDYLKELAKQRMEDTEYLSPAARLRLPSVKWENNQLIHSKMHLLSVYCFLGLTSSPSLCLYVCCLHRGVLQSPLTMKTYSHRFHLLLHLEEIQMEVDVRKYDLRNQTMTQDQSNRKLLTLRVRNPYSLKLFKASVLSVQSECFPANLFTLLHLFDVVWFLYVVFVVLSL